MSMVPVGVNAEVIRWVNHNRVISDSDDADQRIHSMGARFRPAEWKGEIEATLGHWSFDERIGSEDFDLVELGYAHELNDEVRLTTQLQYLSGDHWSPWLASVIAVYQPSTEWRFEGSVEKGLVDSVAGVRQELGTETYSLSADWRFLPQWTLVGALLTMDIDDGNQRQGGVLRLIYDVPGYEGLNLQTRSRLLQSDFNGNGYFSPPELQEHLLLVGYSRAAFEDNWVFSALIGAGKQIIEPEGSADISNDLYYLELRARGWFTDRFGLESKGYCSNTGGPNSGNPDDGYRYCNLQFSLLATF